MSSKFSWITIIIIIIVVFILFYIINRLTVRNTYYVVKRNEDNTVASVKNFEGFSNSDAKLYYFYSDGCPHCTNFKPEWKKAAELLKKKYGINIVEVSGQNQGDIDLMSKYGVAGVPSVVLQTKNNKHEFNGSRDANTLVNFVGEKINV